MAAIPFYFKWVVLLLFFHNSNGEKNSPSVEFCWVKIEGNLRRANTEQSMDFRRANREPFLGILGRPIWNRQCTLGGPIRKPIRNVL